MNGGKLVHMYKWDAGDALQLIERERITNMSGVPVMSRELISHHDFSSRDTSSLMSLGGGGAQLQPDLVSKIDASVATARPGTGYGMTETCGIITSIGGDFFVDRPESCGPAMPSFEAQIVNADGEAVTEGTGELWVRGAPVIKGGLPSLPFTQSLTTASSVENDHSLKNGIIYSVRYILFLGIPTRKFLVVSKCGFLS